MYMRLAVSVLAFVVSSAQAATFTVTNTNDSGAGSLRDAIAQANLPANVPPNTVNFDPAVTGTITLTTGQIQIAQGPLNIVGPGAGSLTINGNAAGRIFSVFLTSPTCPTDGSPPTLDGPDYLVSISGLRLTNGHRITSNAGGAIYTEHSLALDSMTIDNSLAGNGAGMTFSVQYSGQTLTINNTQFLNNKAQPEPAAAANAFGGALAIFEKCNTEHTSPVTATISNSVFSGNQNVPTIQNGFGGAIASDSVADITITDTRIVNNVMTVPNPLPPPQTQIFRGGGIYAHAKSLTIARSEIAGNAVTDATNADLTRGGGLHLFNNAADLQGAGDVMTVTIIDSTISGNSSTATAGAMLVFGNVALELDNTTVNGNTTNQARTGGILISTGATNPPGASNAATPTFTVVSSILANDPTADVSTNLTTIPTFTINATNSLIQTLCPSPTCEITVSGTGNLAGLNPVVGPLAFNGGPTRTHALLAGSPAINAGSNPLALANDQRGAGFARVVGAAADMGAFEVSGVAGPVFLSAASRRLHGAAGTFNLPLSLVAPPNVNHNPTTEPRIGPAQNIVFTFDKPIASATPAIIEGTATAGALTFNGNEVVVPLTGVTNLQYVTVSLTGVASTDGGTGGGGSVRVGFLLGDVNGSRVVAVSDVGLVNQQVAQLVSATNFLRDVNATGTLTVADKGITNANVTRALPVP